MDTVSVTKQVVKEETVTFNVPSVVYEGDASVRDLCSLIHTTGATFNCSEERCCECFFRNTPVIWEC